MFQDLITTIYFSSIAVLFIIYIFLISIFYLYYFRNYFIILIIASIFSTPIYKRISDYINKSKDSLFRNIIIMVIYTLLFIITIAYLVSDTYNPFLYFRF